MKRVGAQHIDAVEDSVQFAMMKALDSWSRTHTPDNPNAWLYQVAYHHLLSEFRTSSRRQKLLDEQQPNASAMLAEQVEPPLPSEMEDSMLRMIYVACHEGIPLESQLVFTLKTLCGFSVKEIALRLFITQANVYKRFSRAKTYLKSAPHALDDLTYSDMTARLPMVHKVLYLMFTEGHLSSHSDLVIRKDLCEEAIRLAQRISQSKIGETPETYALLSLMCFHLARIDSRQNKSGTLLLLEDQDRSLWNNELIEKGMSYLGQAAFGEGLSRYHLEASIVAEHCMAVSYKSTRWDNIVRLYKLLEQVEPSVMHRLNQAIAMAEWQGSDAGLAVMQTMNAPSWLIRSYHWNAVMADLQYRSGQVASAKANEEQALNKAPTESIRTSLMQRFKKYS